MGKKGKKANKKKSSGSATTRTPRNNSSALPETHDNSSDASKTKTVTFCIPDPPEPTSTKYITRITLGETWTVQFLSNLDERLNDILTSNRKKASLPTNDQLAKLKSKTAKRVAIALSRFEIVQEILLSEHVEKLEATTEIDDFQLYSMDDLTSNESILKACVHMILVAEDTDLRLCPCAGLTILELWPIPTKYFIPIKYHPLNQGEMQMPIMTHEEFVVLLATVLFVGQTEISNQDSLRWIHELYLQVENIEWSTFRSNKHFKVLTEQICRNALAAMGIKICRLLYLKKKSDRCELPSDEKFSSKALLKMIEEFARHQMKYSESGDSECIMGWIATQSPAILKVDPLCATADALHWFTKAYTKADKHGNDFISGIARIGAADCILHCGDGIISINKTVLLRRDFRTEFGEKEKNGHEKLGICVLSVDQNHNLQQVEDREFERLESGKTLTELTSEEKHWVDVSFTCMRLS